MTDDREPSATRPRRRGSRRSSGASTPARPACARRSSSSRRAAGSSSSAPPSSTRSSRGMEELRLDELVARLEAPAADAEQPHEHLRPHRRPAADRSTATSSRGCEQNVSSGFLRKSTLIHLHGGGERGRRRGRHLRRASTTRSLQAAGPTLAARRRLDARARSASTSRRSTSGPSRRSASASRNYRVWAYESAALDLALRQAGTSLQALLGREPRPVDVRLLAAAQRPRRAARPRPRHRAPRALPDAALQARPDARLGRRDHRRR